MSDAPQFNKHDDPRYERPNQRWRCGRATAWGKPCPNGPKPDGTCGADAAQPPCVPRPSLRVLRGRATFLVATATVLVLVAGFHFGVRRAEKATSWSANPGAISATHANFTESQGCATCHPAHNQGLGGMLRAAFTPHDMTGKCVDCHTFGSKERLAHNTTFSRRSDVTETQCTMCHTEHHGAKASLTPMTDSQCQHCHQVKFESFTRGHPPFPTNFPHFARNGIQFDHGRHLGDYFLKPTYQPRAPANCQECHHVFPGVRQVQTTGFDQACAKCHAPDILARSFQFLSLPEPSTNPRPAIAAADTTALMIYLLGPTNEPSEFGARVVGLLHGLTNGPTALLNALDRGFGRPIASNLLAGLNRETVSRPASLWSKGEALPLDPDDTGTGWSWLESSGFQFVPLSHSDPVARAWLETVAQAVDRATNADQRQRAQALRNELMNPLAGGGRCMKCHVASEISSAGARKTEISWRYRGSQLGAYTTFSHGTHAGVASCVGCHSSDPHADFPAQFKSFEAPTAVSNFKPITTANCQRCHAESKVRDDCFLCHRYHGSPGLRPSALTTK